MDENRFVTYLEFGAVGDGKTNDFAAIKRAHDYANENNIPVKIENKAGKMHSKSIVIDDELIYVGSMNLTRNGENKNDENMLLIKNPAAAKIFKEQFLYLFNSIPDTYLTKIPKAEGWESIGSCSDGIDNDFDGLIDKEDNGCK